MDITIDDDQKMLRETAMAFAQEAMTADAIRALEGSEHGFDAKVWRKMAEMGWAGAVFPEEYGGAGTGLLELALIVEALGQGAVPSPIYSTVVEAGLLLLDAGSPAQRDSYLPRIASGEAILTTAIAEPSGGLSPAGIRTRITPAGNGFTINGTKLFVRDAGAAEAIICLGRTGDNETDLTLLVVPRDTPGLKIRRLQAAGGEALWEVVFDDVNVDADAVVGEVGGAWSHVARLLLRGAAMKSAELVGIGQASLDLTLNYAKTRVQFDRPIGSFQGVHHHCAEMYRDLEVSRLLAWQAAAALGDGMAGDRETFIAKAKTSEAIQAVTRTAHQIHGAIGFYRDYPLELYYHRAIAAAAAYGDAGHHRRALARMLRENLGRFRGESSHELPVHYV
ncbi:acyl-CoA dehydrogenase family protein [Rhodoplanes sp. Z2-YC6860]|uniref:acyl-CoA dehydrogenase family protein n=1 Tax=Rhodoplanes sp. Z2-YC6860 TaxID=674703 RepID=UPI00078D12B1|nr:acyl-CoA dehydrogenase family protein [Rhodoplanes sp. Z2-YC6860]AMN44022.1 acyl-CoA dehydrogenase [Rhodoplanes sp. Z2-YC6860]